MSRPLAALRQDLGDPLFVRAARRHCPDARRPGAGGLCPGHRRAGGPGPLGGRPRPERRRRPEDRWPPRRFAEHAAGRLLDLFTKRVPGASVDVVVEPAADIAVAAARTRLRHRPGCPAGAAAAASARLEVVPFLRYQRVLVAAPGHPLARLHGPALAWRLLAQALVRRPGGILEGSEEGRWLAPLPGRPEIIRLSSETERPGGRPGGGRNHAGARPHRPGRSRRRPLVRLPVVGTPMPGLWWASTLDQHRTTTMAQDPAALRRHGRRHRGHGRPGRVRGGWNAGARKFHVALWS